MLAQNEIEPGTLTVISLNKLMSEHMTIPNVTWQNNDEAVRYIYVKEHDSQWTSIICMGLTLYEDYPYIGAPNEIRLAPADNPLVVTPEKIFIRARLADDVGISVDIFAAKECRKCFGDSSKGVGRV